MPDLDNKPAVGTAPAAQPTTATQEAPKPDHRSALNPDTQSGNQPDTRSASEADRQQPQPRPCPQDCSKCSTPQHIFCSAKMLFDLSRAYQEQRQQSAELAKAVADIQEQLKPKDQEVQLSIPFTDQG